MTHLDASLTYLWSHLSSPAPRKGTEVPSLPLAWCASFLMCLFVAQIGRLSCLLEFLCVIWELRARLGPVVHTLSICQSLEGFPRCCGPKGITYGHAAFTPTPAPLQMKNRSRGRSKKPNMWDLCDMQPQRRGNRQSLPPLGRSQSLRDLLKG